MQKLKEQKFENFIFCVNYKKQIIEDYFKKGKNFGVKIFFISKSAKTRYSRGFKSYQARF